MKRTRLQFLPYTTAILCLAAASAAHAWDPMAGGANANPAAPRAYRASVLPANLVPQRYYQPATVATTQPVMRPAPTPPVAMSPVAQVSPPPPPAAAMPQPVYYAPPPVMAQPVVARPVMAAAAPAPVATPHYVPAPPPPAATMVVMQDPPARAPDDYDAHRLMLGVEAFYDNYKEPETFPDLNSHAHYGAVDIGYDYYFSPTGYAGFEGRVSYGRENYKSNSGSIHDIPQWEFDARFLGGSDNDLGGNHRIKVYAGLGSRYYLDKSKGEVTNLGALGYERRIFQIYAPIGATYEYPAYGLIFAPNLEIDPLLYGNVQSRLQSIPGYETFNNRQQLFSGVGVRGEFMVKQRYEGGMGWEFGPFFRTWNVADSELDFNGSGGGMEPQNTRFQVGTKLKLLF